VYTSSGLSYYRHPDWLGSSRVASTPTQTLYYDGAYAPFGENYAETGTTDRNFTGQNQDLTPGATFPLYDFLYREYQPTQGRWVSPDPAGMAAVDPTNPQSWDRYAYGLGSPCGNLDPLGLDTCNLNIQVNNRADLSAGQLSAAEAQINAILAAVPSEGGDDVGAVFTFSGTPDYTLNIVNGSPNGLFGWQRSFLFFQGNATVNAAAIGNVFDSQPGVIPQVAGTVSVHELTHRITGVGDLPFSGGASGDPNLMQIDSFIQQFPNQATQRYLDPGGLLLSPGQVSALYRKCSKKHQNSSAGGGGGDNSGGLTPGDEFGWLYLYFAAVNRPYL
jgi:RHS repeat-associated protein